MTTYVRGRRVPGLCDRCGFRYLLKDLKSETIAGVSNTLLVCQTCWDADHPQNFLGKIKVNDPQTVRDPRPDNEVT